MRKKLKKFLFIGILFSILLSCIPFTYRSAVLTKKGVLVLGAEVYNVCTGQGSCSNIYQSRAWLLTKDGKRIPIDVIKED